MLKGITAHENDFALPPVVAALPGSGPRELGEPVTSDGPHQAAVVAGGAAYSPDEPAATGDRQLAVNLEQDSRPRRIAHRAAGALVLAGYMLFGGGHQAQAEATTPATISAQAQPQESGIDWGTVIPILTTVGAVVGWIGAMRNQTNENTANRFSEALQGIKGESTGEERGARLRALDSFVENRKYAPEVFRSAVVYLRGRTAGIEILRNTYKDDPEGFEHAIKERRNADRSALVLFLSTLPAARRQLRRREIAARIKNILGGGANEQQALDELTGTLPDTEKSRVNAQGINLDGMRGSLKRCNLRDVDLTGAGLQELQITSAVLAGARLCEAQFRGTAVSRSDLRRTDLRAAYLHGARFEKCVVGKDTKFGHLPDDHPDAKFGTLKPGPPDAYRGNAEVILKDLVSDPDELSSGEIVAMVHQWQRDGLKLLGGSTPEYFLDQ